MRVAAVQALAPAVAESVPQPNVLQAQPAREFGQVLAMYPRTDADACSETFHSAHEPEVVSVGRSPTSPLLPSIPASLYQWLLRQRDHDSLGWHEELW